EVFEAVDHVGQDEVPVREDVWDIATHGARRPGHEHPHLRDSSGSVRKFVRAWAAKTEQDKDAGRRRTKRYDADRGRRNATVCSRPGTQRNLRRGPLPAEEVAPLPIELGEILDDGHVFPDWKRIV